MPVFEGVVLTNRGRALMAKLLVSGGICTFTRIALGNGIWEPTENLELAVGLKNQVYTTPVTRKEVVETHVALLEGSINSNQVAATFQVREMALYAIDPQEGEILYAIDYMGEEGDWIPAQGQYTQILRKYQIMVTVANAANVVLNVIEPDLDLHIRQQVEAIFNIWIQTHWGLALHHREEFIISTEQQEYFTLAICNAQGITHVFLNGLFTNEWTAPDSGHILLDTPIAEDVRVDICELYIGTSDGPTPPIPPGPVPETGGNLWGGNPEMLEEAYPDGQLYGGTPYTIGG
jgi:hypothetical protein